MESTITRKQADFIKELKKQDKSFAEISNLFKEKIRYYYLVIINNNNK